MRNLLVVTHCPSENTLTLRDTLISGITHPDIEGIELRALAPLDASAEDVLWADALILGTTENFGYMAGRIKDFFERIYYPCLEKTQAMPYALYIRAGNDGTGTQTSIERIITGLKWRKIQEPIILKGEYQESFAEQCEELGMTVAAGLEAGIF